MKKILCLMAVFALSMSFSACGAEPAPAAVEKSPAPTESVEALPEAAATVAPEIKPYDKEHIASLMEKSPVMQALEGTDAKTETWEDFEEYNRVIRAMGFKEFQAGYELLDEEEIAHFGLEEQYEAMGPQFKLEELKYNGEVFRLDLDYTDFDEALYRQERRPGKLIDGWTILGAKGSGPDNISGFANEDFDYGGFIDHAELFPDFHDDYRKQVDYSFCNVDENDLPTVLVQVSAIYYPESGNLYNVIKVSHEDLLEGTTYFPAMLYHNREAEEMHAND
jgi:hypothetical protein